MNNLEGYTEVQGSQHLTQADRRVFGRDYMASTSDVCGKPAYWKEPAEHDHVDFFQSFAKSREWVRQRRDWKVATRGKEKADDTQTTDSLDVLSSVMPERHRLTTGPPVVHVLSSATRCK